MPRQVSSIPITPETGHPSVVILAGPNGAGKTTAAPTLLRDTAGIDAFVNVDTIAKGLSGFDPSGADMAAGRIMLRRLRELAAVRASFGFETTQATSWWLYDNASLDQRTLIACNVAGKEQVLDEALWETGKRQVIDG